MKKHRLAVIVFFLLSNLCMDVVLGQETSAEKEPTSFQNAHEKFIELEQFHVTDNGHFKYKVFTVDKPETDKTHHWFIQVLTSQHRYVNYGDVFVEGHLKDDSTTDFNYMKPVNALCTLGKYIIGFVNVTESGYYILNIKIDNFGVTDSAQAEIYIPKLAEDKNLE